MPITYEWMQDQEDIVLVVVDGDWGWEEFFVLHQKYVDIVSKIDHKVDWIFDFTNARRVIPEGVFKAIQKIGTISKVLTNRRVTAFIMPSSLFQTVLTTFMKLYPTLAKHYRMAQSRDDALAIIAKARTAEKGKQ